MRRHRLVLSIALSFALALGACGGGTQRTQKKQHSASTTTTAPPLAPLTGMPDPGRVSLGRPAVWVKIENTPEARPQAGLEAADVVYEEVAEGGITRFAAGFNSLLPDVVGPIRSVRAMDPDIVWPEGGVFAYSGGAPGPLALIREAPVNSVDETGAGPAMFRDRSRRAPHNLYGHAPDLAAKGGQPVPPPALFTYLRGGEQFGGTPVASFNVGFGRGYDVSYQYDPGAHAWKRSLGGAPSTVASGQQIAPTNVIVEFIEYPAASEGITVGQGDAWVFVDGKVVRGRWQRPDKAGPAQFVDVAGHPIRLLPGRTWVELLPVGSAVQVTEPAPPPTTAPPATTKAKPKG